MLQIQSFQTQNLIRIIRSSLMYQSSKDCFSAISSGAKANKDSQNSHTDSSENKVFKSYTTIFFFFFASDIYSFNEHLLSTFMCQAPTGN